MTKFFGETMQINQRSAHTGGLPALLVLLLSLWPMLITLPASTALAQEKCATELAAAEEKYQQGRLDDAIDLLTACLRKGDLLAAESQKAYRLLAKAYLSKRNVNRAKDMLRSLLKVAPDWRPDSEIDTPAFTSLAEEVIAEAGLEKAKKAREEAMNPGKKEKFDINIGGGAAVPLVPLADSSKIGIMLGASVDIYLNPRLAWGPSAFYLGVRKKFSEPGVIKGGNLSILTVLIRLKYFLQPLQKNWNVYLVGGPGFAISRRTDKVFSATSKIFGTTGNDLVFAIGLGVQFKLNMNTKIYIEGLVSTILIDKKQISEEVITYVPLQMAVVF